MAYERDGAGTASVDVIIFTDVDSVENSAALEPVTFSVTVKVPLEVSDEAERTNFPCKG
jgi:hypothetical protein